MSETARMTKAACIVGAATLLSRILGFVRDVIVAWFFGAGLAADAFFVAFRIPNLLRRLFAEGSLTISFIPVFTEYLSRNGREEAFRLARSAFSYAGCSRCGRASTLSAYHKDHFARFSLLAGKV